MIQIIQLGQGVFDLRITSGDALAASQGECCLELDLGESGTVTELHRRELMDLAEPYDAQCASHIVKLCLELLRAHTSVCGVDFNLLDRNREVLEFLRASNIAVEFLCTAIEGTSSQKYIALRFRKSRFY
jgi:hypothetical protein